MDDVKELLESLSEELLNSEEIIKVKELLDNFQNSKNGASVDEIKSNSDKDPTNKELRFELAEKYISLNEIESGFNILLSMYEADPQWNDEAAKNY